MNDLQKTEAVNGLVDILVQAFRAVADAPGPDEQSSTINQRTLTAIDAEAQTLRDIGRRFQLEVQRRIDQKNKHHNNLTPFYTLPTELQAEILLLALREECGSDNWPITRLFELSKVSSQWWRLVTDTPLFWGSTIDLSNGIHRNTMAIQRSRTTPLNVVYRQQHSNHAAVALKRMSDSLALVTAHAARLKSLDVNAHVIWPFLPLFKLSIPSLEKLVMKFDKIENARFSFHGTPRLKHLEISSVRLSLQHTIPKNLKTVILDHVPIDPGELLHVLSSCRHLASLSIALTYGLSRQSRPLPNDPYIEVPSLRSLELHGVHADLLQFLLTHVQLDNLTTLHLSTTDGRGTDVSTTPLERLSQAFAERRTSILSTVIQNSCKDGVVFDWEPRSLVLTTLDKTSPNLKFTVTSDNGSETTNDILSLFPPTMPTPIPIHLELRTDVFHDVPTVVPFNKEGPFYLKKIWLRGDDDLCPLLEELALPIVLPDASVGWMHPRLEEVQLLSLPAEGSELYKALVQLLEHRGAGAEGWGGDTEEGDSQSQVLRVLDDSGQNWSGLEPVLATFPTWVPGEWDPALGLLPVGAAQ